MRIISVGQYIEHKNVTNELFRSPVSFLDFDLLIWNPSRLFTEYDTDSYTPKHQGCRNISDDDSPKILDDISRRKGEIAEMINLGRIVIVVLPPPEKCYYATGFKEFSGSGKNRVTTRHVGELNLLSSIPVKDISTVVAEGKNIELKGSEPFKTYWSKMKDYHYYEAYSTSKVGQPFVFIKGTEKLVGTWISTKRGVFLFMPAFYGRESFKTNKDYQTVCDIFVKAVLDLSKELKKSTGDFALPEWTKRFLLPGEDEERSLLSQQEADLQKLLGQISSLKEKIANIQKYKLLLSGSGRALEVQVSDVLKAIGFAIEKVEAGRDDLIISYHDKVAVVEIKGVSKSAAEKHAAQLEKWVSEYLSDKGIKPKGILIVNAYCETCLDERSEPAFPDQMISYSVNRDHCLLTTAQLLGIYYHINDHPDEKDTIISELYETKGIYKGFEDYTAYLTLVHEVEAKQK
jgi:hypothetical protein